MAAGSGRQRQATAGNGRQRRAVPGGGRQRQVAAGSARWRRNGSHRIALPHALRLARLGGRRYVELYNQKTRMHSVISLVQQDAMDKEMEVMMEHAIAGHLAVRGVEITQTSSVPSLGRAMPVFSHDFRRFCSEILQISGISPCFCRSQSPSHTRTQAAPVGATKAGATAYMQEVSYISLVKNNTADPVFKEVFKFEFLNLDQVRQRAARAAPTPTRVRRAAHHRQEAEAASEEGGEEGGTGGGAGGGQEED